MLRRLTLSVLVLGMVTGCSSVDVVSNSATDIAIVANNSHEMDNAKRKADRYCKDMGGMARLDRTETIDRGAVAYFKCRY